jgi:hypothetical protein
MEGDVKLKKGTSQKRSAKKSKATEVAAPTTKGSVEETAKPSAKRKQSNTRKKAARHPSVEQIQLRAYFIAERRRQLGIPGDETADWVQAEKELRTEDK